MQRIAAARQYILENKCFLAEQIDVEVYFSENKRKLHAQTVSEADVVCSLTTALKRNSGVHKIFKMFIANVAHTQLENEQSEIRDELEFFVATYDII